MVGKLSKSCPAWLGTEWLYASSVSTPALSMEERGKIGETVFDAVVKTTLAKDARLDTILDLRLGAGIWRWHFT